MIVISLEKGVIALFIDGPFSTGFKEGGHEDILIM
jgi:hypothetical protein